MDGLRRIYGEPLATGMTPCICRCPRMVHVSGLCMGCLKCEAFTPHAPADAAGAPDSPASEAPKDHA